MDSLIATAVGALVGVGLLLVIQGLRGRPNGLVGRVGAGGRSDGLAGGHRPILVWAIAAFFVTVTIWVLTGWWAAALAFGAVTLRAPVWIGRRGRHADELARTQAVATWTESIRDNMAGAAGLEQALQVSVTLAPDPIAAELARFGRRLQRDNLDDSLIALAEDLNDSAADLVVAALVNASRMEVRDLGPLLSRLAASTRAGVGMRQRIEVGRARVQTSARIVVVTTVFTVAFLFMFSRQLLAVYNTTGGQLWLVVVALVFALGGWLLNYYAQLELPARFVARHLTPGGVMVAADQRRPAPIGEDPTWTR